MLFAKAYPDRFFDVGVAEQNLVDIAAGLALGGKRVFASSFAYFLTGRAWDQIRNIVAHDNLDVALVASHGGLSAAADGASHLALQDIAITRVIPNLKVVVPCDAEETKNVLNVIVASRGPFYVRLRREKEPILQKSYEFKMGRAETMRDGGDITIISTGSSLGASLKAAELLKTKSVNAKVMNIHTIKPIDHDAITKTAKETGAIVTVEEHSILGGLGGAVSEVVTESYPVHVHRIGVPDTFVGSSRSAEPFLKEFGLMPEQIASTAESIIQKRVV